MVNPDLLPPQAHELMGVIGLPATLALAEWRGGRWLFIAKTPPKGGELRRRIGAEAAIKLAKHYGGELLKPPKCVDALRGLRDAEIFRLHYEEGWSLDRLAGEYGLVQSSICRALERVRLATEAEAEAPRQASLF